MPITQEQREKRFENVKHVVSYSQFSMWNNCPFRWYLNYVKKHKVREPSIHLLFGTSMHETIQTYITVLFEESVKAGDAIDLKALLKERMAANYTLVKAEYPDMEDPVSKSDMVEFYYDGCHILDFIKKHRKDYFNTKSYELVGIELPVDKVLVPGLKFVGDLDVILQEKKTGKIKIIDIKTATKSWNDFKKADESTTMQLVLYKIFYSDLFKVDADKIHVEFMVVKRKLKENCEFPQKRVQLVIPASGKPSRNKTLRKFKSFVTSGYKDDGEYNEDGIFPKIPIQHNCRFCEFRHRDDLCDKQI